MFNYPRSEEESKKKKKERKMSAVEESNFEKMFIIIFALFTSAHMTIKKRV